MELFIFIVGLIVSTMVVYGILSQVPGEMRPPDKVAYQSKSSEAVEDKLI